jgi:hypothetical protein
VAEFRLGWPPVKFVHLCRSCRHGLKWGAFHRAFFLICCLALFAAICAAGVGLVYLILWLTTTIPPASGP